MTLRGCLAALALAALPCLAQAEAVGFSRLARPVAPERVPAAPAFAPAGVSVDDPAGGLLAQRTIDREWGPSDDSTYRVVDVPGWKSEGLALALSSAVPGAGHLYLGENGGWAFALAEVTGWLGHWYEVHTARQDWAKLVAYMGDPNDPRATFSFERYRQATQHDTAALEQLWAGDRKAFFRELASDPVYVAGFTGSNPGGAESDMHDFLVAEDAASRRQWLFDAALWANHLLAGLDALRAARGHNAPLREGYHLDVGERWRDGEPELHAALVRRF
jgi:hypothetical protein